MIAISSSASKEERLKNAGASDVVVAPDLSFHKQVRALTNGAGVDAVLEIAGRPTFSSSVKCLKAGGKMVLIGNVDPGAVPFNPAMAILKELDFVGSAHATLADLRKVIDLVARGEITPEIAEFLSVSDAEKAHRMMEDRTTSGRIVLLHDDAN